MHPACTFKLLSFARCVAARPTLLQTTLQQALGFEHHFVHSPIGVSQSLRLERRKT